MSGRARRRVAIAVPWFADAWRAAAAAPSGAPGLRDVEWLVTRGRRGVVPRCGWRAWLVAGTGLPDDALQRFPAGACIASLTRDRVDGVWGCMTPVHLLTGLDRLQLAPLADLSLSADESGDLVRSINGHLAGSGFTLHAASVGPWLLECSIDLVCDAIEPACVEGRDVRELLPSGRDGRMIRRLMNELQMVLHEHPVNVERERRGLLAVNTLWPWGFGAAAARGPSALPQLRTDDPWLAGLWRRHGAAAEPLATAPGAGPTDPAAALYASASRPAIDPAASLLEVESRLLGPAVGALRRGTLAEVGLLLGDATLDVARSWTSALRRRRRSLAEWLG